MTEIVKFISNNPLAFYTLIITFSIIITALSVIYLFAFFQGRDISFWPPKIGSKPLSDKPINNNKSLNTKESVESNFFFKWNNDIFIKRLDKAKELKMLCVANITLLIQSESSLLNFVSRGGKIQCIYLEPNGNAIKMAASRNFGREKEEDTIREQIISSLKTMKKISENAKKTDNIEIKLIDYLPSSIITIFDQNYPEGIIYVGLYGFGQHYLSKPCVALHMKDFLSDDIEKENWYQFYTTTFENIWNSKESKPYDIF